MGRMTYRCRRRRRSGRVKQWLVRLSSGREIKTTRGKTDSCDAHRVSKDLIVRAVSLDALVAVYLCVDELLRLGNAARADSDDLVREIVDGAANPRVRKMVSRKAQLSAHVLGSTSRSWNDLAHLGP